MLALLNLEYRRLIPMLPFIGLMLAAGIIPGLINPKDGVVGLAFVSMAIMLLIVRIFPMGSAEDRANTLAATLPTRRRQVISARYTLVTGLVTLLAAVVIIITALQPGESFGERFGVASVFIVAPLLNMVVTGPLSSRGGLGPVGPAIPMVIFAALMFTAILMPESAQQAAAEFIAQSPTLSFGIGAAVIAVLLVLSYLLSIRLFERRDL